VTRLDGAAALPRAAARAEGRGSGTIPAVPPDIAIIVTARDEVAGLAATLEALRSAFPGARLLVADDGSRDGSDRVALAAGAELVRQERPVGKGGAATAAAQRLHESEGLRAVVLCDGDLGASAARLRALLEPLDADEADLVVASFRRRVGGGFGVALGFARRVTRRLTGLETSAPISGQRALRPEVLNAVLPFARGFGMEVGMTVDAHRAGFRLREVELDLEHRATGRTPRGFLHRGRQLLSFARVYASRR
jgi:glycosyltransferase involved in cell wall biosynthesis